MDRSARRAGVAEVGPRSRGPRIFPVFQRSRQRAPGRVGHRGRLQSALDERTTAQAQLARTDRLRGCRSGCVPSGDFAATPCPCLRRVRAPLVPRDHDLDGSTVERSTPAEKLRARTPDLERDLLPPRVVVRGDDDLRTSDRVRVEQPRRGANPVGNREERRRSSVGARSTACGGRAMRPTTESRRRVLPGTLPGRPHERGSHLPIPVRAIRDLEIHEPVLRPVSEPELRSARWF